MRGKFSAFPFIYTSPGGLALLSEEEFNIYAARHVDGIDLRGCNSAFDTQSWFLFFWVEVRDSVESQAV